MFHEQGEGEAPGDTSASDRVAALSQVGSSPSRQVHTVPESCLYGVTSLAACPRRCRRRPPGQEAGSYVVVS